MAARRFQHDFPDEPAQSFMPPMDDGWLLDLDAQHEKDKADQTKEDAIFSAIIARLNKANG